MRSPLDLRLLRAPNPSPMTQTGTNTYIIGKDELCIIDPGPDDTLHLQAICNAIGANQSVAAVLVTHAHRDHSALALRLARLLGVPIMAYGSATVGRSRVMSALCEAGMTDGGEGVDSEFMPDKALSDGETIQFGAETIRAIWTPGHMGNHMCFQWRDVIFSGDHIMGWASSLISPPDGDMQAFMSSLDLIEACNPNILYPGHGARIDAPAQRIAELRAHRLQREHEIIQAVATGRQTVLELVEKIYADTPPSLRPAAARNVHAHLISLWQRGVVCTPDLPSATARYHITNSP